MKASQFNKLLGSSFNIVGVSQDLINTGTEGTNEINSTVTLYKIYSQAQGKIKPKQVKCRSP